MLDYTLVTVFTRASARCRGRAVADVVVERVRDLKTSARCHVSHAHAGCYEGGDVVTSGIEALSYDLPIRIDVLLPTAAAAPLLEALPEIVTDGVVAVQELRVLCHQTRRSLLPRQIRVGDVMTREPKAAGVKMPAGEVARLMLSANFHAVPVVDAEHFPLGIVTQGDLIERAGLPIRLGLLEELDHPGLGAALTAVSAKNAEDVMSRPVVTVKTDRPLGDAVALLLERGLKRLPAVDTQGRLVGMLSRSDIFRTIAAESPDWEAMRRSRIVVQDARLVRDVMSRDAHSVPPDMTVEEILRTLSVHDVQRVAVVDRDGKFLGLLSDLDLLRSFSQQHTGFWTYLSAILTGRGEATIGEAVRKTRAAEVMNRAVETVPEDAPVEDAIRLMTAQRIKRLPVVDAQGMFRGMISRDGLLRAAFEAPTTGQNSTKPQ